MERTTSQRTTMAKRSFIFVIVVVFLNSTVTMAQELSGTFSDVCADKVYTYTISYPNGSLCSIDPANTLDCVGCYDKSVAPDNNSITLKWSPTASFWQLAGKVICRDPQDPGGPPISTVDLSRGAMPPSANDLALITCPNATSTTWTNHFSIIPETINCGDTHTWSEVVTGSIVVYPWSTTSVPLNTSLGGGGGNGSSYPPDAEGTTTHGLDLDHPGITLYWNAGFAGEVTINAKYRRIIHHTIGGCDPDDINALYTQTFIRNPGDPEATFNAPSNVTPNGNSAIINLSVENGSSFPGKIYGARYYRGTTLLAERTSCGGVDEDLDYAYNFDVSNLAPGDGNEILLKATVLDQCGTWWDIDDKTVHVNPQCLSLVGLEDEMKVLVTGGDDSETPGQFLISKGVTYSLSFDPPVTLPSYTLSKILEDYNLSHDFGTQGILNGTSFSIDQEVGSYHIFFDKMNGRSECPDIDVALRLDGRDWILENAGCPAILPRDLERLGFHLISGSITFEHFAGTVTSKSYIEVHPGITLDLGAELILEPGIPQPTGDDHINFVENVSFDEYGRIMAGSRTYFDNQGKATQSQIKNLAADVVLATQTIYDAYGRAAITTLPAPIRVRETETDGSTGCPELSDHGLVFEYAGNFVTKSSIAYDHTNFDLAKENSPDAVDNSIPGTLGWYYSANNGNASGSNSEEKLNEFLTPTTGYPYSRTVWLRDGTGQTKGATSPGDVFKAGGGHVASVDVIAVASTDPILVAYFSGGSIL
jgi:hypothetical protein